MNKPKLVKKTSKREQHQQEIKAAMPEVQALCKKYGRSIVNSCVSRIGEYEKKSAQVEKLRREAAELERKLMTGGENAMAV
jgi:hypothetical protein